MAQRSGCPSTMFFVLFRDNLVRMSLANVSTVRTLTPELHVAQILQVCLLSDQLSANENYVSYLPLNSLSVENTRFCKRIYYM